MLKQVQHDGKERIGTASLSPWEKIVLTDLSARYSELGEGFSHTSRAAKSDAPKK